MININLIANRRTRKMREMMFLRWGVIGVILVLAGMLLLNGWELVRGKIATSDLNTAELNLTKFKEQEAKLDEIEAKNAEKRPEIILLNQARQSQGAWLVILSDLSRIVPHDVVLTALSSGKSDKTMVLTISGYAADEHTLGQFMKALRTKTAWAGNPKPGTITADDNTNGFRTVRFDLTVPINGMIGGDL